MKTLVIYSRSSTQRPRSVLASLCNWLVENGHDVSVLDISSFSHINQDLPPRWYARLFNHHVYPQALPQVLENLRVKVTPMTWRGGAARELPDSVDTELADAIFSDLVTYVNSDVINPARGIARWAATRMRKRGENLYWAVSEYLQNESFEQVYIPNGRVPEQRMAIEACKLLGVPHLYYEIGRAKPQSFYAGKTQVHDREATQAEVPDVLTGIDSAIIKKLADDWIAERSSSTSSINVYSQGWDAAGDPMKKVSKTAVFFSSSVDEFASYGAAWKLDSWETQYEAFDTIMSLLKSHGVHCQLRIHPNLTNKSTEYFQRELGDIRALMEHHPTLTVFWHNEPVNSYDLVAGADYVVVGRSTLGLEASLMGKCVWTTTAARYDTVADVRTAFTPESVTPQNFTLWDVDTFGAQKFVAYWALQDHEFTFGERSWSTWDSFRPPAVLRPGQLMVKNPLRHKVHLVIGEVTKWRNSRFRRSQRVPRDDVASKKMESL